MVANAKRARRWRLRASGQFLTTYELECAVSDRVGVLYANRRPYSFGIYGYPNYNGTAHVHVDGFENLTEAKRAARKSLDSMADYPLWLEQQNRSNAS